MLITISAQGVKVSNRAKRPKESPDTCIVITTEQLSTDKKRDERGKCVRDITRVPMIRFSVYHDRKLLFEPVEFTTYDFVRLLGINSSGLGMILTHQLPDRVETVSNPARLLRVLREVSRNDEYDDEYKFSYSLWLILNIMTKLGYEKAIQYFYKIGHDYGPGDEYTPRFSYGTKNDHWLYAAKRTRAVAVGKGDTVPKERSRKVGRRY